MAADPSLASPPRRSLAALSARRLLAVDAGAHTLKMVLAEEFFGRFRVLRRESLPLGIGAVAETEPARRTRALIDQLGDNPVALALPHYQALSQVIDLPGTPAADVRAAIEAEVHKLSGLGESQIVHDYSPLAPFGRVENPFWVTLCQAAEIQRCRDRCAVGHLDLCEVTTSANALVAAFLAARPDAGPSVLVDLGAAGTVIAIVIRGQPIHTSSFSLGADTLLAKPGASGSDRSELGEVPEAFLRRWLLELQRVLGEWLREAAELGFAAGDLDYYLAGGLAEDPTLAQRVSELAGLRFHRWPEIESGEGPTPSFAVAYGAALHALGRTAQPASLLPDEVRVYWNRHHGTQVLQSVLLFLLVVLSVVFAIGTWQQSVLLRDKRRMLRQAEGALEQARQTEALQRGLAGAYSTVQPVLASQRRTLDWLQTLALLQQTRSNRSFWYVLMADAGSYYSAPLPPTTNSPPATNVVVLPPADIERHALIAELCVPEQGDNRRATLNRLVDDLRRSSLFRNVDSLPDDRRRALADPTVVLAESHFALTLQWADNPFEPLPVSPRRTWSGPGNGTQVLRSTSERPASLAEPAPTDPSPPTPESDD